MAWRPLTILFSGMIAADPHQGGATWAVLQYLLGLRRLGHSVYFVEPIKIASIRPAGAALAESENTKYFREVVREFGLQQNSTLLLDGEDATVGMTRAELEEIAGRADVLINISGMLTDERLLRRIPVRVYLDLDPAFVQMWHAVQRIDMHLDGHTHFVTVGQAIGSPDCPVPTCGRSWINTVPPIVLEHWPQQPPERELAWTAWTTIANWRGYGSIEHNGVHYGQKAHSLRPLIDLPERTDEQFLLALSIHPAEVADLKLLAEYGWRILDPAEVAGTPGRYRDFIAGSKGEFGVAKSGYVASRCGWLSDRSACYLACGRPVVAQETGISQYLPTGEGFCTFRDSQEAAALVDSISRDYPRHCRAARRLAEQHLDSDRVLTRLLQAIGAAPNA